LYYTVKVPITEDSMMRKLVVLSLGSLFAMMLTGCASQVGAKANSYTNNYDVDKIDQVERASRRNGIDVIWVNPPKAKKKTDS
jgi:Na+/citrate or Na+/malate symporter